MRLAAVMLGGLCAIVLAACGNTVQQQPISHSLLEDLIVSPFPVYWLGESFEGLPVTEVTHDTSDAFSLVYGDCLQGGEGACIPALRIVSSPDNSFLPGGTTPTRADTIRGVHAVLAQGGRTILIPTGRVVVDIYAHSARLAAAAARMMASINEIGAPEEPLPAALPSTGFEQIPLPAQVPSPLHQLH